MKLRRNKDLPVIYANPGENPDNQYEINHEEMNKMHTSYEKETNHDGDESAQKIWIINIKSELENFEKYARN